MQFRSNDECETIILLFQFEDVSDMEGVYVITIPNASRKHDADYKIMLKNCQGQDSGSTVVTVLDAPSVPEGPLKATDVNENSIKLEWKPPKYVGGECIINYILEKRPKGDIA